MFSPEKRVWHYIIKGMNSIAAHATAAVHPRRAFYQESAVAIVAVAVVRTNGMHMPDIPGDPASVMDSKDNYLLFGLTIFLHACTFFLLQNVASCFKDYISPLDGVVVLTVTQEVAPSGKQEDVVPYNAMPVPKMQQLYHGSRFSSTNSAASYHALHETLDVSVFR